MSRVRWPSSMGGFVLSASVLFSLLAVEAQGADRMKAPKPLSRVASSDSGIQPGSSALTRLVRLFRTTVTRVDGDRCPMYPTCSQYAEMALAKHGTAVGVLLIVDRLFHEWSETLVAPRVVVYGVERFWDPLEANDFWFGAERRDARAVTLGEGVP